MNIYIQKTLAWILSPMGIITIIFILLWLKFNRKILGILILFVILSSNLPLANHLFKKLEKIDGDNNEINYEDIDYLIILGGATTQLVKDINNKDYLIDNSGRYFEGVKIFKKHNLKKIVISKLRLPWDKKFDTQVNDLVRYFNSQGIKMPKILILEKPLNTVGEANKLFELVGKQRILIVTSAYHAKRSKIIFKNKGFDAQIYKVDYKTRNNNILNNFLNYLPDAKAINLNSLLFKELIGIIYYSILK